MNGPLAKSSKLALPHKGVVRVPKHRIKTLRRNLFAVQDLEQVDVRLLLQLKLINERNEQILEKYDVVQVNPSSCSPINVSHP